MRKKSLIVQFMALLLVVLVVPSTIVATYNFYTTLAYAEEEIAKTAMEQMDSVSATNEMVLFNLVKNTLRLVQSGTFKQIRGMESYDALNDGYENINKAMKLRVLFNELLVNETSIHSAFFVMEKGDYVVSSDKGITRLDQYRPQEWLDEVLPNLDSLSGTWISRQIATATKEQIALGHDIGEETPVMSYVYTLKTLGSSIKGTVVVNVFEKDISTYLNPKLSDGNTNTVLVNGKGVVVSASKGDSLELYTSINDKPYYQQILAQQQKSGYVYYEENGQRYLYAYRQSEIADWLYISKNNVTGMVAQVNRNIYKSVILLCVIILFGGILIFYITSKTLKPVKELVEAVKDVKDEQETMVDEKNELKFIANAFVHMKAKEGALANLLEKTENNTLRLAVRDALQGEEISLSDKKRIKQSLPYPHIMVAYVGLDDFESEAQGMNEEETRYHRYQVNSHIEQALESYGIDGIAVKHRDTISAVVMSFEQFDQRSTAMEVITLFEKVQKLTLDEIKRTVTIGVSRIHCGEDAIRECGNEAAEAYKHKLVLGTGRLIVWRDSMMKNDQFYYPYVNEERILNFVKLKQKKGIREELLAIRNEMIHNQEVSLDNIRFIYNLLAGAVMRYLLEKQINSFPLCGDNGFIYEQIASLETIECVENAMGHFIESVIDHLINLDSGEEGDYTRKILSYIEANYMNDIDFEKMSDEIGISYSYIRKIMKETLGRSLLDTINMVRINKVKELMLLDEKKSLSEIADQVGYTNVQSLNRYFKKFEGITPSSFRSLNSNKALKS